VLHVINILTGYGFLLNIIICELPWSDDDDDDDDDDVLPSTLL